MADDEIRAWLVERTFSDDEQNLVILVYATTDGERYLRKERALTSFAGPGYVRDDPRSSQELRSRHRSREARALRERSTAHGR